MGKPMNGFVQYVRKVEREQLKSKGTIDPTEVWSKIFTPRIGNVVEFKTQIQGKHYTARGIVIEESKDFYLIDMIQVEKAPKGTYLPSLRRISKHYRRFKIIKDKED